MKKLAIFVEGQTEQVFIQKLVEEIAGKNNLTIQLDKLLGGASAPRITINEIVIKNQQEETKYYVLIRDSSTDSRVVSDVRDTIDNLMLEGFERVIGLRDLYPIDIDELKDVQESSNMVIPHDKIPANIVIAVREIETWFLAETNHYPRISTNLNEVLIAKILGFDINSSDFESFEHPSETLNSIYKLVGFAYRKSKRHVDRTVNSLDYENIYFELKNSLGSLNELISYIDDFLTES